MTRKKYCICLCYHGFATSNSGKYTFVSHKEEFKEQIKYLLELGYTFIWPSEYRAWYKNPIIDNTLYACITIDDSLLGIQEIGSWLEEKNLKHSIAIIARRIRKRTPEDGYLSWEQLKSLTDTGLCEILSHTYNLHNLGITIDENGNFGGAPPLEGKIWIDSGQKIYSLNETYSYFDYRHVDTDAWRFPLFGSDPGTNFSTAVNSEVHFKANFTGQVTAIRLWAAIHSYASAISSYGEYREYGNEEYGYDCNVIIKMNDVEVADVTINTVDYETRSQWVEREFQSIELDTPFNVIEGTNYKLSFHTQNIGDAVFCIFAVKNFLNTDFYLNSDCSSLVQNKITNTTIDFPSEYNWPARAGMILSTGGSLCTDEQYTTFINNDLIEYDNAVSKYSNASWSSHSTGYIEDNEDPNLEVLVLGGMFADETLADVQIRIDFVEEITTEIFRFKYASNIGKSYPLVIRLSILVGENWTAIKDFIPNWYEYHWQEIELDTPLTIPSGTHWFRFQTLNENPNAEEGLIRIYMDQEKVPVPLWVYGRNTSEVQVDFWELYNEIFDKYGLWRIVGDNYWHVPNFTNVIYRFNLNKIDYTDTWPADVYFWSGYYDPNIGEWNQGGWDYIYDLKGPGKPFFEFLTYVSGTPISAPSIIAYPFGAYYDGTSLIWKSKSEISPVLKGILEDHGINGGMTIYPIRVEQEIVDREPDLRCSEYTLPRLMLYGNKPQDLILNNIKAYIGTLFPSVQHSGVGWQIAFEPDPYGNALLKSARQALDHVCFDAWFFGTDGFIKKSTLADGGIYLDISDRNNSFTEGETVTESDSGATAIIVWFTNDVLKLTDIVGTWLGGKTITGSSSGATATGDPEGPVQYSDDKKYCTDRGIKSYLILSNYNSDIGDIDSVVAAYVLENQNEYIQQIVDICVNDNWNGIQINLEGIPEVQRSNANLFFKTLSRELHAVGKLLSTTAPAKTGTEYDLASWTDWCDFGEIIKYVDFMKIMSYTESGDWSEPGSHAPDWFWSAVYSYTASVIPIIFFPRVFVGSTNASDIWPNEGESYSISEYGSYHAALASAFSYAGKIIEKDHEGYWEGGNKVCYFGTPVSIKRAIEEALLKEFGGVGIWDGEKGDIYEHFPTYYTLRRNYKMSFADIRFPTNISYDCVGGPVYFTEIVKVASGYEKRNQRWNLPLAEYEVGYIDTKEKIEELISFFRARKGRAVGFRFKEHSDFEATNSLLGTGDTETVNFQLIKKYTSGVDSENRKITRPVSGTVKVYLNSVLQSTGYTVDYATGIVSFSTPPGTGVSVTATFEFDVPVRFDTDKISIQMKTIEVGAWVGITMKEIRE